MIFCLAGFSALSASREGFLIPFFSTRGANISFAQELDENFRIIRFVPFPVWRYFTVAYPIPLTLKKPEDRGILAIRSSAHFYWGGVRHLRRVLRDVDLAGNPFTDGGVARLIGDRAREQAATSIAQQRFNSAGHFELWRAADALESDRTESWWKLRGSSEIQTSPIRWLSNNLDHQDWTDIWRQAVRHLGQSKEFIDVSEKWLAKSAVDHPAYSQILATTYRGHHDSIGLVTLADRWLSSADCFDPLWPRTAAKRFRSDKPSEAIAQKMINFLICEGKDGAPFTTGDRWAAIFVAAARSGSLPDAVFERAAENFGRLKSSHNFLHRVFFEHHASINLSQEQIAELQRALLVNPHKGFRWASTVARSLKRRFDDELLAHCHTLLVGGEISDRLWPVLTGVLERANALDEPALTKLYDWLTTSDWEIGGWAAAFLRYAAKRELDGQLRDVGRQWLLLHPDSDYARALGRAIGEVPLIQRFEGLEEEKLLASMIEALSRIGGYGTSPQIIKGIRDLGVDLPIGWPFAVRRVLHKYCPTSEGFCGRHLFDRLEGGSWRLAVHEHQP